MNAGSGESASTQSHWDEDPQFPLADWKYEVANDDTLQGYHDWCLAQREQATQAAETDTAASASEMTPAEAQALRLAIGQRAQDRHVDHPQYAERWLTKYPWRLALMRRAVTTGFGPAFTKDELVIARRVDGDGESILFAYSEANDIDTAVEESWLTWLEERM